ncbi:hypothetical protein CHS0354_003882 [Potamilus streckersoni]|uniref:ShKT domain-containing protein n=1 Tax=Potamilus streckersoni TaxID=2493646 RepID=A0AAE0TJR4_9BIVA|nr:hypothetical protein CHS0354_003882 [Potamilus streckersoni]
MNKFIILLSLLLLCVNPGKSQFQLGFMTDRPTPRTFNPDCKDQLDNCYSFSKEYCRAPYEQWAKDYCANTCGFCIGPTTPALPCTDNITNCESYGTNVCTDLNYRTWANKNCRYTCRLCADGFIYTTTTLAPEKCVDKVECRRYGNTACSGQYKDWSHDNCPMYCGYCQGIPTPPPACVDKIPNCQGYEKTVCTSPTYQQWAEDNCRNYCGFCTAQPAISFAVTPPLPGKRDEQRAPLKKRQFSANHHHNGVHVHPCWDQNTNQVRIDDPNCLTTAPSIDVPPAVTTSASGTTAAFPGSEFDPHPTPPKDWDSKDTVTEKKNTTTQKETTKPEPGITSQITNVTVSPNGTQSAGNTTPSLLTMLPGSSVTLGVQNVTQLNGQSTSGSTPTIITVQGNATILGGGTGTGTFSSGQIGGLTNVTAAITTVAGASHQTTGPLVGGVTAAHTEPHVGGSTTAHTPVSNGPHVTRVNTSTTTKGSSSTSHGTSTMTASTTAPASSTQRTAPNTTSSTSTPVATPSQLTTTPTTIEPTTAAEACKDRLENCRNYPIETACHGIYEAWAKFNCPDHCGFCPKSTTLKPCLDKLPNCKEYDSGDLCTTQTYRMWSEDNCFAYCKFGHCGAKSGNIMLTTKPTTTPSTTTTEDPNCRDISDRCVTITDQQCFGIYEAWARSHCAYRCGFCKTTCYDKNQNCDKYESEICTAHSYQGWARTNCQKFCNMCDPPTPPPTEFGKTRSTVTQQTPGHMTSQIPTFTVPTVNKH